MNIDLIAGSCTLRSLSRGQAISYDERIVRLKETKMRVTVKFSEEHAFGMLIAKYGDEVTSRTTEMAAKDILSRLILHNLHTFLYHRFLSQKELAQPLIGWGWSHNAKKPKRLLSDSPYMITLK